jgi:hypothetical protein
VDDSHITDEISSVLAHNHELTFPKLLVVGDLVMVTFTFSNLEDSLVSFERELEVLEFFGIYRLESHVELVLGSFISNTVKLLALET